MNLLINKKNLYIANFFVINIMLVVLLLLLCSSGPYVYTVYIPFFYVYAMLASLGK